MEPLAALRALQEGLRLQVKDKGIEVPSFLGLIKPDCVHIECTVKYPSGYQKNLSYLGWGTTGEMLMGAALDTLTEGALIELEEESE